MDFQLSLRYSLDWNSLVAIHNPIDPRSEQERLVIR